MWPGSVYKVGQSAPHGPSTPADATSFAKNIRTVAGSPSTRIMLVWPSPTVKEFQLKAAKTASLVKVNVPSWTRSAACEVSAKGR